LPYHPQPIDSSGVTLSADILELTDRLAENAHDNWALARMADGWVYGPKRDDVRKQHPCLIAYDELPESEKQYDRRTAMETLKAILALGYVISRRS
jgi:ryanodine receptor 2